MSIRAATAVCLAHLAYRTATNPQPGDAWIARVDAGKVRVLITTAGSTGDVAPYTGVGARLLDAGHQVTVAAHESFGDMVAGAGLDLLPIPGDVRAVQASALGRELYRRGTGVSGLVGLARLARRYVWEPAIAWIGALVMLAAAALVSLRSRIVNPRSRPPTGPVALPPLGRSRQPASDRCRRRLHDGSSRPRAVTELRLSSRGKMGSQ